MIMETGQTTVMPPSSKPSVEEVQEAFVAVGARSVNVRSLEEAAKAYSWLQQVGAKSLAVTAIMKDVEFWKGITEQYDPIVLGKHSGVELDDDNKLEYLKFRKEISELTITSYKELVKLADPNSKGPDKRGVKASISPVVTINPLAGRV